MSAKQPTRAPRVRKKRRALKRGSASAEPLSSASVAGDGLVRCPWASSPLNTKYHDEEWGTPVHDDRVWFEFLILEGAQAGLSWGTILRKRERYRELLRGFDPGKVTRFDARKLRALMRDPGIVRNRLKLASTVTNAKAFLPRATRIRQLRQIPSGTSSAALRFKIAREQLKTNPRKNPFIHRSRAKTCSSAASVLLAPPFATRSCKPPAWSTII